MLFILTLFTKKYNIQYTYGLFIFLSLSLLYIFATDVIDWILDNLIEKNRTRRAVIKKLKELGLIFKAPTRKSVAAGVSKHAWHYEQDQLLKELYDKHRLEEGNLNDFSRVLILHHSCTHMGMGTLPYTCTNRNVTHFHL